MKSKISVNTKKVWWWFFLKFIRGITMILILCFLGSLFIGVRLGSYQSEENFTTVAVIEIALVLVISSLCFCYSLALSKKQANTQDKTKSSDPQLCIILQELEANDDQQMKAQMHERLLIGRNLHITHIAFPNDLTVSSQHCRLIYEEGVMYLEDLHSMNGTYLNGIKIGKKEELHQGDILTIGRESLRISWSSETTR